MTGFDKKIFGQDDCNSGIAFFPGRSKNAKLSGNIFAKNWTRIIKENFVSLFATPAFAPAIV
jgi:hypothetical protein